MTLDNLNNDIPKHDDSRSLNVSEVTFIIRPNHNRINIFIYKFIIPIWCSTVLLINLIGIYKFIRRS